MKIWCNTDNNAAFILKMLKRNNNNTFFKLKETFKNLFHFKEFNNKIKIIKTAFAMKINLLISLAFT